MAPTLTTAPPARLSKFHYVYMYRNSVTMGDGVVYKPAISFR